VLRLVKTRPSLRLGPSETAVIRVLDQERIDRINQDLTRAWKADVETTCVLSGILLLPCLILICLLDGPLFAKVILCTFLCLMVGGWCIAKWLNAQAQPRTDITGVQVEQLEGYFDRRWVRNGGKPYIEYSFGKHWLHIQTSACSFFSGDTQLKLNRRYRVDALYLTGHSSAYTGYYLLEETFKEIFDDSDLSATEKIQIAEREKRINQDLEEQHKRLYRLYRNPQGELEAVAIGFNFAACFLTVLWSFCVSLHWVTGLTLAALGLILLIPDTGAGQHWFALGWLLSAGVFGACGNLWRERQVLSKGFVQVDALLSCNPDQAKVQYKRKVEEAAPGFGQ